MLRPIIQKIRFVGKNAVPIWSIIIVATAICFKTALGNLIPLTLIISHHTIVHHFNVFVVVISAVS